MTEPIIYQFSEREAFIIRKAFHKQGGQNIRGELNIASARHLEQAGLVSIEDTSRVGRFWRR